MTPEEQSLLRRTAALSEENNALLQKLERRIRWQTYWGFAKIIIFLAPLIIGYIFLQPYLGSLFNTYSEVQGMINNPESPNSGMKLDAQSLKELLHTL